MVQVVVAAVSALGAAASGLVFVLKKNKFNDELEAIGIDLTLTENEKFDALAQVDDLQQKVSDLRKALDAAQAHSKSSMRERRASESANGDYFAEKLQAANDVNVRLQAQVQSKQSKLETLLEELRSKQDEVDDANAQRDIANDTLRDVVHQREKLCKDLKSLEAKAKEEARETAAIGSPLVTNGLAKMGGSSLDAMLEIRNEIAQVKMRLQTEQLCPTEHNMLLCRVTDMSQTMHTLMAQSDTPSGNGNGSSMNGRGMPMTTAQLQQAAASMAMMQPPMVGNKPMIGSRFWRGETILDATN
mmetsp:Transcript_31318/g.52605  ORF Transcript_31318/g.52605 Transcript_31318/m.52605 type:complete len:302 (+) Transcript_31318:478-1383(+)